MVKGVGKAGVRQYLIKDQDVPQDWWALFHSPELNLLIQEGILHSPNLASAKAALEQARELLRAQIGESYFPSIALELSGQRARISGLFAGFAADNIFTIYAASLQANYVLDVFGGQRRLVETYRAKVDYARYEWLGAYLTLTSNIATTYIDIASLQAQIAATKQLIRAQSMVLSIVNKQLRVGGASQQNLNSQATLLAQTKATLPPLLKNLATAQDTLAILVGRLPSQYKIQYYKLNTLTLPAKLPVTVPSLLVEQRPDIQASQALLHEACAQIGVETANLLPQITISGSFGYVAQTLRDFFNPANMIWSYGANLLQNVFKGGALLATRRAAIAAYEQAFAQYQQTVLEAFKEVADALNAITIDAKELQAQYDAEASAKRTLIITTKQFQVGGENYLNVLSAQEQYLKAKLNRILAQSTRYTDTVVLFQVMGGGWWHEPIYLEGLPKPAASRKGVTA